jgi:hypothetical protein
MDGGQMSLVAVWLFRNERYGVMRYETFKKYLSAMNIV